MRGALVSGTTSDIFIRDGMIEEISLRCEQEADRIIDGRNKAALPSLINGHTHAAMTLLRGYADDLPLKQWLEENIWVLEAKLTEEDVYWGTKLACLEMIKNGVTVFNDMYWHFEGTARAVREMGLRALVSAVLIDRFDPARAQAQAAQNLELFELAEKYAPNVTFCLGPHAIYTVSPESLRWVAAFAEAHGLLIHMHLGETEAEITFARQRYGRSLLEFLDDCGILSRRFIGCHGVWLDENDCSLLARRGASLVHNPVSNLKLGVGRFFPYRLVRDHGIPFCLGTDGPSSNNCLDMLETMKLAALLAKFSANDPAFFTAADAIESATRTAARILGLGDWELMVGNRADLILVDLDRPEFVPNFDLFSDLVYAANGSCVDTVICMGRVLMEHRHVEGEEEIMGHARRLAHELPLR